MYPSFPFTFLSFFKNQRIEATGTISNGTNVGAGSSKTPKKKVRKLYQINTAKIVYTFAILYFTNFKSNQ